jgi:DHA1 family tetracycline resistance protein-like MFS transporter
VLFLMQLAHIVYPSTFVLYADYRFGWGAKMVGYTLAIVGVLSAVVQAGLIKKIIAMEGERRTLLLGLLCGAAGFVLYGLAPTGYWFWAAMPIAALWGVSQPAAQAIITRQVDPHEQGRLQGAITSLASVAGIIGPSLFTRVLAWEAHSAATFWSGATFFLAGGLVAIGFVIAYFKTRDLPPMVQSAAPASEPAAG